MRRTLHTYQCSFCKSTATTTLRTRETRIPCVLCRRFMRFLFSVSVPEAEWQAQRAAGVTYNNHVTGRVNTKRPCDACKHWVERDSMIRLDAGGTYCSAACADRGTEQHRIVMEGQRARLEALYQQQPWLRPPVKEQT